MRERWFGSTGRRVPQLAVDGDPAVPLDEALVLESSDDLETLRAAHAAGRPIVVRADTAEAVIQALARPEVASVLVPDTARELLGLDLTELTYD